MHGAHRRQVDLGRATPLLVAVTGPAASGKTTLARELAASARLPLLEKDGIKELLVDVLGTGDREWSRRLGRATFPLLYDPTRRLLDAGTSLVVEASFAAGTAERDVAALPRHRFLQLHLDAPADVLTARSRGRAADGTRHCGHPPDTGALGEPGDGPGSGPSTPLDLPGRLIEIDTASPLDVAAPVMLVTAELGGEP